jgi:hypothetical protein
MTSAAAGPSVPRPEIGMAICMVVWRPERRNRNIGTKRAGYAKANDMRIPESWLDQHGNSSLYYERLNLTRTEEATIGDFHLKILYEKPKDGFSYGCSPADVVKLLAMAAKTVPALPDIIAFRQPTRKQHQQFPVWGRFLYYAEFGKHQGTAIVLEAQKLGFALKLPKTMSLEDRAEHERLVDDGHSFVETKRHFHTHLTEDKIRNTTLYRTFLHELGHLADYHMKALNEQVALDPDQNVATDLFFSRPISEREVFAHRFAENLSRSLKAKNEIPFEPQPFQ